LIVNIPAKPRTQSRLGIALAAAGLAACAGIPEDRGLPQVQALLQARGYPEMTAPDSAQAGKLADELLAQEPLSADTAVRIALLLNPSWRAGYARLGISAAAVYDAGRLSNPRLSAGAQFTGDSGAVNRYDFGVTEDFLDLLLLPSRSRLAAAEFERTREEAAAAVIGLSGQVLAAYRRLVGARQIAGLRQAVADAAEASAALAQRYFDAGNMAQLDLELQRAAAGQAQADVVRARNEALAARAELGRLMGLTAERDRWQVPERLSPLPTQDPGLAELQALARRSRLDLAAKRSEVALREQALGITREYQLVGEVELGVQGERDDDGAHLLGPALAVQLPLFNQGQGALLRAESQLELSRAELSGMEVVAGKAVELALAQAAAARALAQRYAAEYVPQSQRIVRYTQQRANFQLIDPFALIRARQQEYDTYQRYIETVRDYWVARAELECAVGARPPGGAEAAAPPEEPGTVSFPSNPGARP
jgi:cobalt-zinc-cadmium efflux system outer membrane protein